MSARIEPNAVPVIQAAEVPGPGTPAPRGLPQQRDQLQSAAAAPAEGGFSRFLSRVLRCFAWLWNCLCCRGRSVAHGVNLNSGRAPDRPRPSTNPAAYHDLLNGCNGCDYVIRSLDMNSDLNARDARQSGSTLLQKVCAKGYNNEQEKQEILNLLRDILRRGAEINAQDNEGRTALHRACSGMLAADAVKELLQHGANPDLGDARGCRPVHIACERVATDIVALLYHAGADMMTRDAHGRTPLHYLCKPHDGLKTSDKALVGMAEASRYLSEANILATSLSLAAGFIINVTDDNEDTPLHLAAKAGKTDLVRALVETYKADLNPRNENGSTPLNLAIGKGRDEVVALLKSHRAEDAGPARKPATKRRELPIPSQLKVDTPPSEEASDTDEIRTQPLPEGVLDQIGR